MREIKLSKDKFVKIDKPRARRIAKFVNFLQFAHPEGFSPRRISKESDLLLLYILVGICHQINWNFLMNAIDEIRIKSPSKFTPEYLNQIGHEELISWLSAYSKKERLYPKMKRAELVRDMAKFLMEKYDGKILNLASESSSKMGGRNGMYTLLAKTIAYGEDPLRKKATVFIDLADELGLVKFSDWENYIPPIDYHISRIFLRTGVIKVLNKQLLIKLMKYQPVHKAEDLAIRKSCIDAIIFMSGKDGKRRKKIQGIFWALGRDCCHENGPNCENCQLAECACKRYITNNCYRGCFLRKVCRAFKEDKTFLKLREQNFITTWY